MPHDLQNRKTTKPSEANCFLCGLGLLICFMALIYSLTFIFASIQPEQSHVSQLYTR